MSNVLLSTTQKELFNSIGQSYAQSKIDSDKAVDDFAQAVVTEVSQEVDGVVKTIKAVDYYLYEQASLAWKSGYAQKKGVAMYLTDSKLNPTLNNAFSEFMSKCGDRHGIAKPTKPTEQAQGKHDQREKAKQAKEALMELSYANLEQQANDLRIKGSKEAMKEAVKLLDIIEAKKKAEVKAVENEFKTKHKLIKELVVNCNNHTDLDTIIEMLKMYQPDIPSIV
jgi:hypothetical protein